MLSEQQLNTNEMIGELTDRIAGIEREETALLDFNNAKRPDDAEQCEAHEAQIGKCAHLVLENLPLLEDIVAAQEEGHLRFLDRRPFTIAIYRLKAAILQSHAVRGKLRMADGNAAEV